ncbi:hypothetical protein [Luteitalea sp.]
MTAVWTGKERTLEQRARAFDQANPHVFEKLLAIAREARDAGATKIGIKLLFERLRWVSRVETRDDLYRLNNSYTSYYARRLMAHDPSLAGLFETRSSAHDPNYLQRVVQRAARVLRAQRASGDTRSAPRPAARPQPSPRLLF